jgi:hypothetical protein
VAGEEAEFGEVALVVGGEDELELDQRAAEDAGGRARTLAKARSRSSRSRRALMRQTRRVWLECFLL